jgi:hypothetical protein
MSLIEIKTAIGKLLLSADANGSAKHVITAFDPSVKRSINYKALNKFNIDVLENCAVFLGIDLADVDSFKLYTKDSLINRILFGLLALLPSSCSECDEQYVIEHGSHTPPVFKCHMCFQGSHDCSKIKDLHEALASASLVLLVGHIWLCHDCKQSSNPIKARKSKSRHNSVTKADPNLSRIRDEMKNQLSSSNLEHSPSQTPQEMSPLEASSQVTLLNSHSKKELDDKLDHLAKTRICSKYKVGKCPHGIRGNKVIEGNKCDKEHPKRCFKFCAFGNKGKQCCTKGDKCEYYHPVLCKFSMRKKVCTNKDCTYVHLKGTKRTEQSAKSQTKNENSKVPSPDRGYNMNQTPVKNNSMLVKDLDATYHFLELKRLVETVQSNFRQEIAEIRSSLSYHQPLKFPYFQYQPTQLPPGMSYTPRVSS